MDENLYHTSYESGMLEDPMVPPIKEMFKMVRVAAQGVTLIRLDLLDSPYSVCTTTTLPLQTVDPTDAPDAPEKIRIEFEKGAPVKVINHQDKTTKTDSLDLFLYLNEVKYKLHEEVAMVV